MNTPGTVPTEIELKLRFPLQYTTTIKELSLLKDFSIATPLEQDILSIYFDTPDLILRNHRIALRTRKIGDQWLQTIKSNGTAQSGLHRHHEWEFPITTEKPELDLIQDQDLKIFFSDKKLRDSLQPVFTTDFHRTTYLLEPSEKFRLEFCLDTGRIIANNKTALICELELELKAGNSQQLMEFGRMLQKHCPFKLIPENTSKAMRGFDLLDCRT
ncbi:MAG: CYTH domain-containing protein [Burkholderiales bacterium]|nr:CYTH domain-containing protein [Burkholderiales bacterium]